MSTPAIARFYNVVTSATEPPAIYKDGNLPPRGAFCAVVSGLSLYSAILIKEAQDNFRANRYQKEDACV